MQSRQDQARKSVVLQGRPRLLFVSNETVRKTFLKYFKTCTFIYPMIFFKCVNLIIIPFVFNGHKIKPCDKFNIKFTFLKKSFDLLSICCMFSMSCLRFYALQLSIYLKNSIYSNHFQIICTHYNKHLHESYAFCFLKHL